MAFNAKGTFWTTGSGAVTPGTAVAASAAHSTYSATAPVFTINNTANTVTLQQGDVIQFANVFAVNPQNRAAYGSNRLRNFVVTAAVTQVGAGNFNVVVTPALISAGQFQNVTVSPTTGAAVTNTSLAVGTANAVVSPQNILFHRNAYTLAVADLELPEGVHFAGRASDKELGLSIRIVRQYTINNDAIPTRLDVLYGWAPLYQELACRVAA